MIRKSRLNDTFVSRQAWGLLIDAAERACLPYLMTPAHENEKHYNRAHILTRNVIERVFAWLNFGLRIKMSTNLTVIVAACVLHNIAAK